MNHIYNWNNLIIYGIVFYKNIIKGNEEPDTKKAKN